jgi:hypothetical protein
MSKYFTPIQIFQYHRSTNNPKRVPMNRKAKLKRLLRLLLVEYTADKLSFIQRKTVFWYVNTVSDTTLILV